MNSAKLHPNPVQIGKAATATPRKMLPVLQKKLIEDTSCSGGCGSCPNQKSCQNSGTKEVSAILFPSSTSNSTLDGVNLKELGLINAAVDLSKEPLAKIEFRSQTQSAVVRSDISVNIEVANKNNDACTEVPPLIAQGEKLEVREEFTVDKMHEKKQIEIPTSDIGSLNQHIKIHKRELIKIPQKTEQRKEAPIKMDYQVIQISAPLIKNKNTEAVTETIISEKQAKNHPNKVQKIKKKTKHKVEEKSEPKKHTIPNASENKKNNMRLFSTDIQIPNRKSREQRKKSVISLSDLKTMLINLRIKAQAKKKELEKISEQKVVRSGINKTEKKLENKKLVELTDKVAIKKLNSEKKDNKIKRAVILALMGIIGSQTKEKKRSKQKLQVSSV